MRKKYQTNKQLFLFNMIAFIGFSFEFYIRNDLFFGSVIIFVGLLNLIAYLINKRLVELQPLQLY
jgi:uncharacterized membrane protein